MATLLMSKYRTQLDPGVSVTLDASNSKDNKDVARQEFKDEADINYMLSRFGVAPRRGTPIYGEWDDTVDLQVALQSVSDARSAYRQLPDNLKAKFTRMEDLLSALENGSLVIKNEDEPTVTGAAGTPTSTKGDTP